MSNTQLKQSDLKASRFSWFYSENLLLIACIVLPVIAGLLSYHQGLKSFGDSPKIYTHYNNFVIFKNAFMHLIEGKDLYVLYPQEHWDLYKYSPAFAMFMGLFYYLPVPVAICLFNLLNSLPLLFAIKRLKFFSRKCGIAITWFIIPELFIALQGQQTNGLILASSIFAFSFLEQDKIFPAVVLVMMTVFIKIFGLVAFAMFIFYPNKLRAILQSIVVALCLLILPLIVVSFQQLISLYESYWNLLKADETVSYGFSVLSWLKACFHLNAENGIVLIAGLVTLLLALLRWKKFNDVFFRNNFVAALLVWMVIFNHKAESPTFVIAMGGVALWYFNSKRNWLDTTLVVLAFVFSSLSPTDIFPKFIREQYVLPYVMKGAFVFFVYLKIVFDLMIDSKEKKSTEGY